MPKKKIDQDDDLVRELISIMDKGKGNKIRVGDWKKTPQCCPPCPQPCPPPCRPKCDYKQDLIVIEDGCVQACEQEYQDCEQDEDDDYQIQICSLGGNIHMPQPEDLLSEAGCTAPVEVPSSGDLLDISDSLCKYNEITESD